MTDKVVILVTCGSLAEGRRIASALVKEKLAACVSVSSPVRSLYRWRGKLRDEAEVLLVIKTARELFDRVRRTVERLHSYQVPEVICLPIIDGAPNYLNWLTASLTEALGMPPKPAEGPAPARPSGPKKRRRR
jgi:periplasmic divalent cation tolerance protein